MEVREFEIKMLETLTDLSSSHKVLAEKVDNIEDKVVNIDKILYGNDADGLLVKQAKTNQKVVALWMIVVALGTAVVSTTITNLIA